MTTNICEKTRKHSFAIMRIAAFMLCVCYFVLPCAFAQGEDTEAQAANCRVMYSIRDDWGTGATVDVTITNYGSKPLSGWTLAWTFPGNQTIASLWRGTYTQNGNRVAVTNLDYNSTIAAYGGAETFGFNITYTGSNEKPQAFFLNGAACPGSPTVRQTLPGTDYSIGYTVREDRTTSATIDVSITNMRSVAVNGWTLEWTFAGNQQITSIVNGSYTQTGQAVSVKNNGSNANIPARGGKASFTITISYTGANKKPVDFKFNGASCLNTATTIQHQKLKLSIPAGATTAGSVIEVTSIEAGQIRNPSSDIPNVSSTVQSAPAFEVTLDGNAANEFLKDVNVSIVYDPAKLPESIDEGSVFVYYYDEASGTWQPLARTGLDTSTKTVSCSTKHFCQMIAGSMIMASESPEGKGVNTLPKNMEKAAPLAGIRFMEPPAANNRGTANLSYPLPVPEGINGNNPQLAIAYSNEARDGNCGFGWSFTTSSITLDASKGLPKFDGTDKLLWDGNELVDVGKNTYRCKVEGSFVKIIREGDGFTVYQGNGSRLYYGSDETARLADSFSSGRTFGWYLSKSLDKFGNSITYEYNPLPDSGSFPLNQNIYLKRIIYGHSNAYSIDFTWIYNTRNGRIGASRGFLVDEQLLLDSVVVNYKTSTQLKKYVFVYESGAFGKTLLTSIEERSGSGSSIINKVKFGYDTDVSSMFGSTVTWPVVPLGVPGDEDIRYTFTDRGGLRVEKYQHTEIDLVDFNGDGLPDRVAKERDDANFHVQFNTGTGFTGTYDYPANDGFVTFGNKDLRFSESLIDKKRNHTLIDFADFNGDGRPDRVAKLASDGSMHAQLNTGSGFLATILDFPVSDLTPAASDEDLRYTFTDGDKTHTEVEFIDVNRDGRPDRVAKQKDDATVYVQYATDSGFSQTVPFTVAKFTDILASEDVRYVFRNEDGKASHTELDFVDLNGDGLPDRVAKDRNNATMYVQYNTGNGFTSTVKIATENLVDVGGNDLRYSWSDGDKNHTEVDLVDVNADGLSDRVAKNRGENFFRVQFNLGRKFGPTMKITVPSIEGDRNNSELAATLENQDLRYTFGNDEGRRSHTEIDFVDMNGDGLPDRIVKQRSDPNFYIQFNTLAGKNRLVKITNTTGTEIELMYGRTMIDPLNAQSTNNYMQRDILAGTRSGDPDSLMVQVNFGYTAGVYDCVEREFRGFGFVRTMSQDLEKTYVRSVVDATYRVADTTGERGNNGIDPVYDQYLFGQTDTVTRTLFVNGVRKNLGKERYVFEKLDVLSGYPSIRYPVLSQKRAWLYNSDLSDNKFMGKDAENGDLTEAVTITLDTSCGLVTKTKVYTYNDPNHTWDDILSITDNTIDAAKWYCLKSKVEQRQMNNLQLISTRTLAYNADASLASETMWNDKGTDPVTSFAYDSMGNITKITEANGLSTNLAVSYPMTDKVYMETTSFKPEKGFSEIKRYDAFGRVYESVNARNELSKYVYNDSGRLTEAYETVNGTLVNTSKYTYGTSSYSGKTYYFGQADSINNTDTNDYTSVITFRDRMGREVQAKTESIVNGTKVWVVSGVTEYDKAGRVSKIGSAFTSTYTESDRSIVPFQMKDPVTKYEYDDLGRTHRILMASGLIMENTQQTIIDSSLQFNRIFFKATNRALDSDENVLQESRSYTNVMGQTVRTERVLSNGEVSSATTVYNLHGYSVTTGGTVGKVERQKDSLGRLQWERSPDTGLTTYAYDSKGLLSSMTEEGRNETDSVRRITSYSYDPVTNDIIFVDREGTDDDVSVTYYPKDESNLYARSNIKKAAVSNGFAEEFNFGPKWYEEFRTIDGKTYTTRYEYDVQGRIKNLIYPDTESVSYSYNDGGLLDAIQGTNQYIKSVKYDMSGRRISVRYGNDTVTEYTYEDKSQALKNMTVFSGAGQELANSTYVFDLAGHLSTVTDSPGGSAKSVLTYASDSRTDSLSSSTGAYYSDTETKQYSAGFSYDADARITGRTLNEKTFNYVYTDATHELSRIDVLSGGTALGSVDFTYDDFGNITGKTNADLLEQQATSAPAPASCSVTYTVRTEWNVGATVDVTIKNNGSTAIEGWALSWSFPGTQKIYELWNGTYMQNGALVTVKNNDNNASIPANGGTVTLGFNLSWSGSNPKPTTFTVNGAGSGSGSVPVPKGANFTYAYDSYNNLVSVKGKSMQLSFVYDPSGQRIKKTYKDAVATVKETLYIGGLYTVSADKASKYIHDGMTIIASKLGSVNSSVSFYHANHIGSTTLMTDSSGEKSQSYLYLPYGQAWIMENGMAGTDATRLFTGQEFDKESGLYYYNARYYDPAVCVFMSPDPAMDGFNVYAYCKNNPITYTDPTGLFSLGFGIVISWTPEHGFGAGFGIAVDFTSGKSGIGVNASYTWNGDGSKTATIGAQVQYDTGIVGIGVGVGYSYNTYSGTQVTAMIGANIYCVGIEISTAQQWTKGGDYVGGKVSFKGYLGNSYANYGGGYEIGWGAYKSGWFTESKLMGMTIRNGKVTGYSSTTGMKYNSANGELTFNSTLAQDFKGLMELTSVPFTIGGAIAGVVCVVVSQITKGTGYIEFNKDGMEFVTTLDLGGAITFGFARIYASSFPGFEPNGVVPSSYNSFNIILGEHEAQHTVQWQQYGILFVFVYFINGGWWDNTNWMENEADSVSRK